MDNREHSETSSKKSVSLAMGQLLVEGGEPERNFQRAEKMIQAAAVRQCDLILLPECIDFAWTHPSSYSEAQPIPGPFSDKFCGWARQYSIYMCVGLTEKRLDERLFNTAILINDFGEIILKYHKINLLDVEQPFYEIGDILSTADTPWGRMGVNICADNYKGSVHIGKTLASMGARIILSPSSWTVDYGISELHDPYKDKWIKPLSFLTELYDIVIASTTSVGYIVGGPYVGKKMVGRSLAINNRGVIKQGRFNEFAGETIYISVDLDRNNEKGTLLGKKIASKGVPSEVELWKKRL